MNEATSEIPSSRPATWTLVLGFALVYLSWGTTYLAIQAGVRDEHLPPALFGGTRVCLAGIVLLTYLALRGQPLAMPRQDWARVLLVSLLLFVAGNGLVNVAERTVHSGVTAVLAATTPLWIGLFEMLWPGGERLTGRGWLGLTLGLAGVLLVLADKLKDADGFLQEAGPFLVLGSAGSWALGSLVLRHKRLACSHLAAAAYQMVIGGGSLALIGCIAGELQRLPEHVTPGAIAAFVYLLIVGSLVGFVSFNWLLGHVPAAKVSTYAYVNPVVAVFVGWWLAAERIDIWFAAGLIVILTGVALVRHGERPSRLPLSPAAPVGQSIPGSAGHRVRTEGAVCSAKNDP
jgi:drug/metabolite transporter (DMT)-like permease